MFFFAAGIVVKKLLLTRLIRAAEKTQSATDDILIKSLFRPTPLWFLMGGAYLSTHFLELPASASSLIEKILLSLLILSITFWAAHLGTELLRLSGGGEASTAATGVVRHAVKLIIIAVGMLVLLSTLGISIAPVLTTVGIGGIAVALGLQETLANLFAGMQITLSKNVKVGDFVRLESGDEGYIEDIHWRATKVRTLQNNWVLIPNSRLAQSIVTNYHSPSSEIAVIVQVQVHYMSDLDQVEKITCEVARNVTKTTQGAVTEFEPFIRYHTLADSGISFSVILRAKEFTDSFLIKHEFIKTLIQAYARNGIVIPFPVVAVNLTQEKGPSGTLSSKPNTLA